MTTTAKKAAEWEIKREKVAYYCSCGYISGAFYDNTKRRWYIPDDARKPFVSKAKNQKAIKKNLLKAIDNNLSFNAASFHCAKELLDAIIEGLLHDDLIIRASNGWFVLTDKGQTKTHRISDINPVKDVLIPLAVAGIGAIPRK